MKNGIKIVVCLICVFLVTYGFAFSQQNYPTKPVSMLHGFPPGGNTDLSVRILGEALAKIFKQPFVTVPKPGGGGTIQLSFLARQAPDGYTIAHSYAPPFSAAPYLENLPYKLEDFKPIIGWQSGPKLLLCRSNAPFKNVKDVVAAAKTKQISFGNNGKVTAGWAPVIIFAKQAGIALGDVPFKGDAEMIAALLGGHIDLASTSTSSAVPFLESGQVRALVCYGKRRSTQYPNVPTWKEEGYDIPIGDPILMAFAPKGTPDEIVKRLHDAIKSAINDPNVKAEFEKIKQGLTYLDAKEVIENIEKERVGYYPLLKEAGLTTK